jgi:hypothetical protein
VQSEGVEPGRIGHWITLVVRPGSKTVEFCDSRWKSGPAYRADRLDLYGRVVGGLSLICYLAEPAEPAPRPPPPRPPEAPSPPGDDEIDELDFTEPVSFESGRDGASSSCSEHESGSEDDAVVDLGILSEGDDEIISLYRRLAGLGVRTYAPQNGQMCSPLFSRPS